MLATFESKNIAGLKTLSEKSHITYILNHAGGNGHHRLYNYLATIYSAIEFGMKTRHNTTRRYFPLAMKRTDGIDRQHKQSALVLRHHIRN